VADYIAVRRLLYWISGETRMKIPEAFPDRIKPDLLVGGIEVPKP
jgi:hypothetical protein